MNRAAVALLAAESFTPADGSGKKMGCKRGGQTRVLREVKVLDLTDERAIYGVRLVEYRLLFGKVIFITGKKLGDLLHEGLLDQSCCRN